MESILSLLQGVKPQRDGSWLALCPAHDDREPSLHVSLKGDRILFHCFAGCSVDSICSALGITTADLFLRDGQDDRQREPARKGLTLERFARERGLDMAFLRANHVYESDYAGAPAVGFCYLDREGDLEAVRLRIALTGDRFRWRNGAKPANLLYGAWHTPTWRQKGVERVLLVEGETDCLTLWFAGIPAVGVAGADCLSEHNASLLDGFREVLLWREPDAGGRKLLETAARLFGDHLRVIEPPEGVKDASDLWLKILREEQDAEPARERFRQEIESLMERAEPYLAHINLSCASLGFNAGEPELAHIEPSVPGKVYFTVADILAQPQVVEQSLPLLGDVPDYFAKGRSHLLAGEPKAGKSELVWQSLLHWTEERVLVLTEEPVAELQDRFLRLHVTATSASHVTVVPVRELGLEPNAILRILKDPQFSVLVVDTLRTLFAPLIRDENDNAQVSQVMGKILAAAGRRTSIILHHTRKGGGSSTSEKVAGGFGIPANVDRVLLLEKHPNSENRLTLEVSKRGRPLPSLLLEWQEDRLRAQGTAEAVAFDELRQRVLRVLESAREDGEDWLRKRDILSRLGEPAPSDRHLRNALSSLVRDELVERDPPEERAGATYQYRVKPNLARQGSYSASSGCEPLADPLAPLLLEWAEEVTADDGD